MANRDDRCCRYCKSFRMCDPDVFTLIAAGKCIHLETHFKNPYAADVCWLFEKHSWIDRLQKFTHKVLGLFRARKRCKRWIWWWR